LLRPTSTQCSVMTSVEPAQGTQVKSEKLRSRPSWVKGGSSLPRALCQCSKQHTCNTLLACGASQG
jgi:hypothetical protein